MVLNLVSSTLHAYPIFAKQKKKGRVCCLLVLNLVSSTLHAYPIFAKQKKKERVLFIGTQFSILYTSCLSHFCKAKMQLWRAFLQACKNASPVQISLAVTRAPLALATHPFGPFWLFFFFLPNEHHKSHTLNCPRVLRKACLPFAQCAGGGRGPGGSLRILAQICMYVYTTTFAQKRKRHTMW